MARDYKNRAAPKPKKKEPTPGWVWFASGLLVGLFGAGLVWLKSAPDNGAPAVVKRAEKVQAQPPQQPQRSPEKTESKSVPEESGTPKPRFDFYTILPEMEVVVPDPEPEALPEKQPDQPAPVVTPGQVADAASADYMLQMGSFRKFNDADRLKASLALVGLTAEIQRFTLPAGDVVYRVRSGPYTRGQVNTLRGRLKQNNINSLTIKLKK